MISHSKPWITESDIAAVEKKMRTGILSIGTERNRFSGYLRDYFNAKDVYISHSGTTALILALRALNIGADDEVILPAYVCNSILNAIRSIGAKPVLCDIGPEWHMTLENIIELINNRTKAIIIVYIFGITYDLKDFLLLGIPIIEDCCQAFGAEFLQKRVGCAGSMSIVSFHPTKCLTAVNGGALIVHDDKLVCMINDIIKDDLFYNSISDLHAVIGIEQIQRYPEFLQRRRYIASRYFELLPLKWTKKIKRIELNSMFYRFPLWIENVDFDSLKMYCENNGIMVRRGVDELLHRNIGLDDEKFPNAVKTFNSTVSIPIYPSLEDFQQIAVSKVLVSYYNKQG